MASLQVRKGVGRTELILLLAVLLILMGIAVLLLGGFNFSGDLKDGDSYAYWNANTTMPFAITNWAQINTTMYLTLSNRENARYILRRIALGNVTADLEAGWTVGAMSEKNISIHGLSICDPSLGTAYSYMVAFYYEGEPGSNLTNLTEVGAKPLAGHCVY